jgi:hypothetical protein
VVLSALEPQDGAWRALAASGKLYRFCANSAFEACNWLIESTAADTYCAACSHNRTIPDVTILHSLTAWRKIEGQAPTVLQLAQAAAPAP